MARFGLHIALISMVILFAEAAVGQGADLRLARGHFGDFNGDGKDDVLLRHASGSWSYYPMDGRRRGQGAGGADLVRDRNWLFAGIGDFNGDGNDDVLLRHVDGRWRIFAMNGREVLADQALQGATEDTQWHFAAVGDFDGDGYADVLLRHDNGRWLYQPTRDGAVVDGSGRANMTRNLAWRFAGVGDLNGDGKSDVLLRQEDGRWYYYPMDGRLRQAGYGTAALGQGPRLALRGPWRLQRRRQRATFCCATRTAAGSTLRWTVADAWRGAAKLNSRRTPAGHWPASAT